MEIIYLLISFINSIFIKSLFISILSIILVGKVLKTNTRHAFVIIKALILVYAGLNISYYYMAYFSAATMDSVFQGTTGPYSFAYYLMIMSNTILPLLLLFKRLGRNKYLLLFLSFLMNTGWLFELFIIYDSDLHRDNPASQLSYNYLWFIALYGIFIGSVIYAIGRAFQHKVPAIDVQLS